LIRASASLGGSLGGDRIEALTIGGTESTPRVLTLAENGCKLAQFSLPPNWGRATSTRWAPAGG
jgi:acyl-CoA synthetase (NDP forming)